MDNTEHGYETTIEDIEKRLKYARTLDDYMDIDPSMSNDLWWLLRHVKATRLKSRLLGVVDGFNAGATVDVKEQERTIANLEADVKALKTALELTREECQHWASKYAAALKCESPKEAAR